MSNGMNSEKAILWTEKWTPIVIDVEGVEKPPRYEVSNFGRLRSFQNNVKGEIIKGGFYENELQKSVYPRIFFTEKRLGTRPHLVQAHRGGLPWGEDFCQAV
jgi:hypothetical protein